jgi:hypothetical protein
MENSMDNFITTQANNIHYAEVAQQIADIFYDVWSKEVYINNRGYFHEFRDVKVKNVKIDLLVNIADTVKLVTIHAKTDWLDNFNPEVVREAAIKKVQNYIDRKQRKKRRILEEQENQEIQSLMYLVEKYPDVRLIR